ncbi:hypothetical protein ACE103_34850 [Bradyrhizobium sp. ma5]|uniref:hypothetical protein n=1 Tax=Bradyrhizobium sp. ma5 TaxID=3344828 RepID=UPI0035D4A710
MFAQLDYLRFNTSVPVRLKEFAILIQARLWTSQVVSVRDDVVWWAYGAGGRYRQSPSDETSGVKVVAGDRYIAKPTILEAVFSYRRAA